MATSKAALARKAAAVRDKAKQVAENNHNARMNAQRLAEEAAELERLAQEAAELETLPLDVSGVPGLQLGDPPRPLSDFSLCEPDPAVPVLAPMGRKPWWKRLFE